MLKDWNGNAPFELEKRFPKTYEDFEKFADWAVQLAYCEKPDENFSITKSWLVK